MGPSGLRTPPELSHMMDGLDGADAIMPADDGAGSGGWERTSPPRE